MLDENLSGSNVRHEGSRHIEDLQLQMEIREMLDDVYRNEAAVTEAELLDMERQDRIRQKTRELVVKGFTEGDARRLAKADIDGKSLFVEGLAAMERRRSGAA